MKNVVLFLSSCLLLTSCGKTIIYGKPPVSSVVSGNYGEDVIVQSNNNSGAVYNNSSYRDENILVQSKNNVETYNNYQDINAYKNAFNNVKGGTSNVNIQNQDRILSDAMVGSDAQNSALLVEDMEKGQIELSSRDEFSTKKNKQQLTNYNNNVNNYTVTNQKEQNKVKYSTEPVQVKNSAVSVKQQKTQSYSISYEKPKKSYKIQCGNYVNERAAQQIANRIKSAGISNVSVIADGTTHRILVGDFNSKEEGFDVFDKIESLNLKDNIFWTYR